MTEAELLEYFELQRQWEQERAAAPPPDPLAEALIEPVESLNSRHRREIEERDERWRRERTRRERTEAKSAVDWWTAIDQRIAAAVLAERERLYEILAQVIAGERKGAAEVVECATARLREQVSAAEKTVAEFQVALRVAKTLVSVVKRPDGVVDVFGTFRTNDARVRNAMREATESAKADYDGPTITLDATAVDAAFTAAKRSLN